MRLGVACKPAGELGRRDKCADKKRAGGQHCSDGRHHSLGRLGIGATRIWPGYHRASLSHSPPTGRNSRLDSSRLPARSSSHPTGSRRLHACGSPPPPPRRYRSPPCAKQPPPPSESSAPALLAADPLGGISPFPAAASSFSAPVPAALLLYEQVTHWRQPPSRPPTGTSCPPNPRPVAADTAQVRAPTPQPQLAPPRR